MNVVAWDSDMRGIVFIVVTRIFLVSRGGSKRKNGIIFRGIYWRVSGIGVRLGFRIR